MAVEQKNTEAQSGGLAELDQFSEMLRQTIKPRTKEASDEVDNAVTALVRQVMGDQNLVSEDVLDTLQSVIASLDKKLSDQMNAILHHPEFQKIESAWRGLAYTVNNSETDATLRVKVMNISKSELELMFNNYPGARWDKSPLNLAIYEAEYGTLGGKPFGALVGDYYFGLNSTDVDLLGSVSKIAAAAHAPFISAASPELLGLDTWSELSAPPDISEIFLRPEYAKWNGLRDREDARYLALTMPRVLAREPYSQDSKSKVSEFAFEEETDGHKGEKYAWMNAAHAMAVNINRAHKMHGWTVQIRGVQSGGEVLGLDTPMFDTGTGAKEMKIPTEVSITDRREAELSAAGLLPLVHRKHTDKAAFIGAQSVYKPKKYKDDLATASDNMSARLPYIFAVSRFSHYLKCMVRDKIGQSPTRLQLQTDLQSWINRYVSGNPETASEKEKAKKPLAGARVEVLEDEENPGYYVGKFFLKPHFQLEGMDIGMSLVSKLPTKK